MSVTLKISDNFQNPISLKTKSQMVETNDYDEKTRKRNSGFTLFESSTLKEIFNFQSENLENHDVQILARKHLNVENLALLNKTNLYAIIFTDQKQQCEFYAIDLDRLKNRPKREDFEISFLSTTLNSRFGNR